MIRIKIHNVYYTVELVEPFHITLREDALTGRCDSHAHVLYINNQMNRQSLEATILHEITHAVIWEYTQKRNANSWTEEELVIFVEQYAKLIIQLTNEVLVQIDTGEWVKVDESA